MQPGKSLPGKSLIDHMRQTLHDLNKAERRVADIVLQDIDAATRLTIADLAKRAAVSEPTVMRFARRMGADGFTAFKMRLSQDFATGRMFVLSERDDLPRDAATIASQVYEATAQALAYSFAQRDPAALEAAAAAIDKAGRVFCLGVGGSSANVASEAENRLFRFGVHATCIVDPYRQVIAAAMCEASDVLLVFSVTGRPASLIESAKLARQQGASVITVTRPGSRLAKAGTVLLGLDIPDDDRRLEIPNRSRYGQFYILDCLASLLGTRRLETAAGKLQQARTALVSLHGPTDQQPIGD